MEEWVAFTLLGLLSLALAIAVAGGILCLTYRESYTGGYRTGWLMVVSGGFIMSGNIVAALVIRGLT